MWRQSCWLQIHGKWKLIAWSLQSGLTISNSATIHIMYYTRPKTRSSALSLCNQAQQPRHRLWQLSSASGKEKWLSKLWQEQKWIIFFFCILSWLKFELLAQIPTFAEFLRLPISKRTENTNANYKTDKGPSASFYVYVKNTWSGANTISVNQVIQSPLHQWPNPYTRIYTTVVTYHPFSFDSKSTSSPERKYLRLWEWFVKF